MRLRIAFEQPDQARRVRAHQVEQVWREFDDTEQDGLGEAAIQEVIERSRLLRLERGEPIVKTSFGFVGSGDTRSVREQRGQCGGFDIRFRVSRRG